MVCFSCYAIWGIAAFVIFKFVLPLIQKHRMEAKLARWNNTEKDKLILHCIRRGFTVPHGSPFVLKVETFLRMAKIPYEVDISDAWGPKGRFPWISLNGEHIADSQFIIDYLLKKFEPKLNGNYNDAQLATAAAARIMMDEHFFWGLVLYRFVWSRLETLCKVMGGKAPKWRVWLFRLYAGRAFTSRSKGHGMGLHTQSEITDLASRDLHYLSRMLGTKKFILGDEPCLEDCGIFGQVAQCVWGLPESEYERLVNGELKNLKEYALRMKETFWPDWDECLKQKQ